MSVTLTVNGHGANVESDPETPLLWVLREELGLTGTRYGCGAAQCGACTVHVDGRAVRSCVMPLSAAAGRAVTTIEGLQGKVRDALVGAWIAEDVPQCGWCQTGQVMSAAVLLEKQPAPSDADVDAGMAGNVCRCATYVRIRSAIHRAAATLKGGAR
jgi:isoquinoline 1-oxidoreductase subunit alpha